MINKNQKNVMFENIEDLSESLLELDAQKLGTFISLISYKYMKKYKMPEDEFLSSLTKSINMLNEGEY